MSVDQEAPTTLSARSPSNASTILYFRTDLDPSVAHQLEILNIGASADEEGSFLAVGGINVTTVEQSGQR